MKLQRTNKEAKEIVKKAKKKLITDLVYFVFLFSKKLSLVVFFCFLS